MLVEQPNQPKGKKKMATQKKSSSKSSGAKKPQVKVADMKPAKDAKGGRGANANAMSRKHAN